MDPIISERGGYRVIRGGSWSDVAAICRTAHRNMMAPSIRTANGGFRVALSPSVKWPEAEQGAKPLRVGTE